MSNKSIRLALCIAVCLVIWSCLSVSSASPAAPTEPPAPTATQDLAATQQAQQTADARATQEAQAAIDATKTAQQAATSTQAALNKAATLTQAAAVKKTATAEVKATSEAQEQSFATEIQKLFDQGVVSSTEGDYYHLEDYEDTQAKLNYFFPTLTGYEAENFVLSASMAWESASMNANWPTSGCGFVYSHIDDYNKNLTFLGLDGYVYSFGWQKGNGRVYAFRKWGKPELPKGFAEAMLVVWNKRVTIYVNGVEANQFYHAIYRPGEIALTVVSGTNAGFGTRCTMNNINLWIFK